MGNQARLGQLLGALLQWRVDDVMAADDDVVPRGQWHTRELWSFRNAADGLDQLRP